MSVTAVEIVASLRNTRLEAPFDQAVCLLGSFLRGVKDLGSQWPMHTYVHSSTAYSLQSWKQPHAQQTNR